MKKLHDYPLGYSEKEAKRLAQQALRLEELTANLLRQAGLTRGMRVLDIGCGIGDVSLLAASIVGAEGSVLGVDRATSSINTARSRASARALNNVHFEKSELAAFDPDQRFDAVIGRLVLLYIPEPANLLQRLSRCLGPGGIVAMQEYDMTQLSQIPPSELFETVRGHILAAFSAAGAEWDMGSALYSTFLRAGLPAPSLSATTAVGCGLDWHGYDDMIGVLRSLIPVIERSGIADASKLGIDDLADRLREEATLKQRVCYMPRMVGAWSRTPCNWHALAVS